MKHLNFLIVLFMFSSLCYANGNNEKDNDSCENDSKSCEQNDVVYASCGSSYSFGATAGTHEATFTWNFQNTIIFDCSILEPVLEIQTVPNLKCSPLGRESTTFGSYTYAIPLNDLNSSGSVTLTSQDIGMTVFRYRVNITGELCPTSQGHCASIGEWKCLEMDLFELD